MSSGRKIKSCGVVQHGAEIWRLYGRIVFIFSSHICRVIIVGRENGANIGVEDRSRLVYSKPAIVTGRVQLVFRTGIPDLEFRLLKTIIAYSKVSVIQRLSGN